MTTRTIAGLVALTVVAMLAPGYGFADDRRPRRTDDDREHRRHHRDHRRPTVLLHPGVPSPFVPHAPGVRFGPGLPFVSVGPRAYVPPLSYYEYLGPAYVPPAPTYTPDATVSIVPPGPSVVEYPTGRYELRGDGIWTPYTWVWIPKPPSAPPAEPPPPPPSGAPIAPEPERQAEIYRWTDKKGTVHWTDRWDAVPEAYRATATKTKS